MPREFADSYVYPGSQVLKNIPGFKNEQTLKIFEYEQSAIRSAELARKPHSQKFDLQHLQALHKHLFQDVYAWAGEIRTVNLRKNSTLFAQPAFIQSYTGKICRDLAAERHLKNQPKTVFVGRLSYYFTELNAVHPFREGNGRSTRIFIGDIARDAGYVLDQCQIDNSQNQWNDASARAHAGDPVPLTAIFHAAIRPERAIAFEADDPPVAIKKFPELSEAFASLRAADAYATSIVDPRARTGFLAQTRHLIQTALDEGKSVPATQIGVRKHGPVR